MRRVVRILRLVESLELVDVPAVVRDRDARALAGVMRRSAADRHERVAPVLLVQRHGVHHVVVLRVGLHLVVEDDLKAVVFQRFHDLVHGAAAAQPGGHHENTLESQLLGLGADQLMGARAQQSPRKRVELLDRKWLEQFFDLHGRTDPLRATARAHCDGCSIAGGAGTRWSVPTRGTLVARVTRGNTERAQTARSGGQSARSERPGPVRTERARRWIGRWPASRRSPATAVSVSAVRSCSAAVPAG